jgi:hypothetical protein
MNDEQLLATHDMSTSTARCRRCGFAYGIIVEDRIACGKAPPRARALPNRRGPNLAPTPPDARYGFLRLAVHPKLRDRAIERAKAQHVTLSEIVRRGLEAYLGGEVLAGWSEKNVREAIKTAAAKWVKKPVEVEGAMLVFGMTPQMVDELVVELYRQGRRVGR